MGCLKMGKVKLVFQDSKSTKVLFGEITSEDEHFISLIAEDGTRFRISKRSIITIKEVYGGS